MCDRADPGKTKRSRPDHLQQIDSRAAVADRLSNCALGHDGSDQMAWISAATLGGRLKALQQPGKVTSNVASLASEDCARWLEADRGSHALVRYHHVRSAGDRLRCLRKGWLSREECGFLFRVWRVRSLGQKTKEARGSCFSLVGGNRERKIELRVWLRRRRRRCATFAGS